MASQNRTRRPPWQWYVVEIGKALFWLANCALGLWIVWLMLSNR
jgi:hypothetical protein